VLFGELEQILVMQALEGGQAMIEIIAALAEITLTVAECGLISSRLFLALRSTRLNLS
jgi:hypothetical protein